ncbi:hypothetical protein JOD54_001094 [Actinokineospora baliensis]|uniref:hypothetical protein n=1 Tax=Actinokineospora baliensis TaxID=547056 RepID=UPI0019574D0F|nr:hypothetical protein [Actinokineospora baliensis]MBM7770890.1 hypothetical protein [Actinokineospora baliensis]
MRALLERFPALTLTLIGVMAAAAVRYVPALAGVDVDDLADWITYAIVVATGAEIHRRVRPVSSDGDDGPDRD